MSEEKKISIKAIIIGLAVDIGGSMAGSFLIGIITGVILISKGVSPDRLAEELSGSRSLENIALLMGFTFTFLGGYIAAHIAKADEIKHALIVGALSMIFSLILSAGMLNAEPIWLIISLFTIPFAVLGGYLRKITREKTPPVHNI